MAIQRALPSTFNADSSTATNPSRAGSYLEAYVLSIFAGNQLGADEGSYYVATNATLGTAITGHAAPVIADADTKPLLFMFNGATNKTIFPDYLHLQLTAVGTGGTAHYTTIYLDNKGSTSRTGGGTAITPVSVRSDGPALPSGITLHFGAVTAVMSSSVKVGQQLVREVIPVANDTFTMKFGGPNAGIKAGLTTAGTATNHLTQFFPALAVRPGGNLNISQIRASQSAAADYQFEFGFWVR